MKLRLMPLRALLIAMVGFGAGFARGDDASANSSAALHARYLGVKDQLVGNSFRKPLHLDSGETSNSVTGDVVAVVDFPFAVTKAELGGPDRWCDILMLHPNTKYCRATTDGSGTVLRVHIGKKHEQPLEEASRVEFVHRIAAAAPGYLKVVLSAAEGPLGTRDYRIVLEAIPLDDDRSIIRLNYSYAFGLAGRLAMQGYLATVGSDKVGFTVMGKQSDGGLLHIGGMRGLAERNTMRYFLAIEASLGALSALPQARLDKGLRDWFAASERYPRQLHELEQDEYLDMKRREFMRARRGARVP